MNHSIEGQCAIVTGGLRGIGLAISRKLQSQGVKVAVWGSKLDYSEALEESFAPDFARKVDISNAKDVERAFSDTLEAFGYVDILVNNAGINGPVLPIIDYPLDMWDKIIAVDLSSVFYCCRMAIPHMKERKYGRIINIASIAGKEGVPQIAAYSAAKGGVISFTKAIAKELVFDGVLVNAIAPAMVETNLMAQMTPEHIELMRAKIPMGRFLQKDEIADMVAWVASPQCSFTTGFTFDITGGRATY